MSVAPIPGEIEVWWEYHPPGSEQESGIYVEILGTRSVFTSPEFARRVARKLRTDGHPGRVAIAFDIAEVAEEYERFLMGLEAGGVGR